MIPKEIYFASLTSQLHNTIKQQHKGVLPSSNTSISNSVSTHKKLLKVGLRVCGASKTTEEEKLYVMKCQPNTTRIALTEEK